MVRAVSGFRLTGARVALGPSRAVPAILEICGGRIHAIVQGEARDDPASRGLREVDLDGYLILPGLINAHDHLEFNLFPRLGRGPYPNSVAWARDIYRPLRSPVREQLAVPKAVRLWWGGLKNLLSGVTTVCHHNPYDPVFDAGFPVGVVRRYGWAHSLTFGTGLHGAFRAARADAPFIVHLAEGTDEASGEEIFALDRMGVLDRRTVLVHGVALTAAGHALRQRRGAALVWCPTSNLFTLGTTLDARSIPAWEKIALGSDSALTAQGTLLDEIRFARAELPPDRVYRMVTESAADILRLRDGEGRLRPGAVADLVAVPWSGETPAAAVARMDTSTVAMVVRSGILQLASPGVAACWPSSALENFEWISMEGTRRRVRAPVRELLRETERCLGREVRLAGRRVSA